MSAVTKKTSDPGGWRQRRRDKAVADLQDAIQALYANLDGKQVKTMNLDDVELALNHARSAIGRYRVAAKNYANP